MVEYFMRALNGEGCLHAANSVMSAALYVADRYTITPMIYDDSYIAYLMDYSQKHSIHAIVPLFDIDLPVLSEAKARFSEIGVKVLVSDYEVTQICNDKWRTWEYLNQIGVYAPKTYVSIAAAKKQIQADTVTFPLVVKPRWGMGSIGIAVAENICELDVFYSKVKNEIANTYLKYESRADMERCVIIQERLTGQEYGLDVINDLNGNYIGTLVKRKLAMRSGETDSAVTEENATMQAVGAKLAANLKHVANLDVDCFLVGNMPYVLELNCRFGGGYPFSHLAGANVPLAIIQWLKGVEPQDALFSIEYGVESYKEIIPTRIRPQIVL